MTQLNAAMSSAVNYFVSIISRWMWIAQEHNHHADENANVNA